MYANMSDHICMNIIKGSVEVKRPTDVKLQQVVPHKKDVKVKEMSICVFVTDIPYY